MPVKDPLYDKARELIIANQSASVAMLQRILKLEYERAKRLMVQFEGDLVTEPDENGVRKLLNPASETPSSAGK